ncbi:putative ribonuclease H-like domain-containing protein, partial [Tanacetum coccineum]
MAREAEFKKERVFNTGNGVAKPVWTNANRVNHSNKFVPRSVQINSDRPNINTGRTNINSIRPTINTGRTNVNPVRTRVNTGSSNVNTVRSRQPVPNKNSNSFSPKRPQGNWGSAVKTSAGYNWRNSKPNFSCDSGPTFIRTDHPPKNMVDRDLSHGMKVIGTKWVYRNKRDDRGVVIRNKARLVAQGYTQEEGIDYDEVF